ncbi:hypothetical protein [Aurantiacibacter sp. D1-12]|uniref:hypothetical protein n=1 Tax=Aurantiacibacter sp. D1-12 TaxID=2993658 RepID=UPI00237CABF6|nr:hypothetical protein [Aurantiacibacter sp. D1-12]MDE1466483.1 hypothetical protein [Aurantiacibacter sp. D1-12]
MTYGALKTTGDPFGKKAHHTAKKQTASQGKAAKANSTQDQSKDVGFIVPSETYYGWVYDEIQYFATHDTEIPMGFALRNDRIKLVQYHPDWRWAQVQLFPTTDVSDDTLKDEPVFVRLDAGIFWGSKSGRRLKGGDDHDRETSETRRRRFKYIVNDPGAILYKTKKGDALGNILQQTLLCLVFDENIFITGDGPRERTIKILHYVAQENRDVFRKAEFKSMQENHYLKLHSVEYLQKNEGEFLYTPLKDTWAYTDSYVEQLQKDLSEIAHILTGGDDPNIIEQFGTALAGFVSGVLYGFFVNIKEFVTGIVGSLESAAELINIFSQFTWDIVRQIIDAMSFENILNALEEAWDLIVAEFDDMVNDFNTAWNSPSILDNAFAVGVLIGYVVTEVVLMFFTAGLSRAAKIILSVLENMLDVIELLLMGLRAAVPDLDKILKRGEEGYAPALTSEQEPRSAAQEILRSIDDNLEDLSNPNIIPVPVLQPAGTTANG